MLVKEEASVFQSCRDSKTFLIKIPVSYVGNIVTLTFITPNKHTITTPGFTTNNSGIAEITVGQDVLDTYGTLAVQLNITDSTGNYVDHSEVFYFEVGKVLGTQFYITGVSKQTDFNQYKRSLNKVNVPSLSTPAGYVPTADGNGGYDWGEQQGGVTPEELTEALALKQNKLTAGDNIDITNNVISSNQPTAINPFTLSFGDEDYNGSAPKLLTAAKIGAATEDFVNSSIATNTAFFKGTFNSVAELPTEDVTNNDYAFVVGEDEAGNTTYTRYKYNAYGEEWIEEYVLNNSSFTAEQWATIQSGITEDDVSQIETNRNAIDDLIANMPDSPEDVNAQPVALTISAMLDDDMNIVITDSRYKVGDVVNYTKLFTDAITSFNSGTDVVLRIVVGEEDDYIIIDLKCNCLTDGNNTLLYEGHNMAAVIVVALSNFNRGEDEENPVYVEIVAMYNVEPSGSLVNADDDELTTAKAQKEYFQKKIDSSNKIDYSNINGTPNLASVALSGSYNDLSNKPALKTVATSGSYNDLSNKPTSLPANGGNADTVDGYHIVVSSSEPPSGTASNIITLVTG